LPNRLNFVITSANMENYNPAPHGAYSGTDVGRIVTDIIDARHKPYDTWIIGGAQLIESCLPVIDEIWLSRISGTYNCDVFLPRALIELTFELVQSGQEGEVYVDRWRKI